MLNVTLDVGEEQNLEQPFISVIVITFNQSRYLKKAISSLEGQTYPKERYEVIVINDGSTDDTARLLQRHARVKVVSHERRGVMQACNEGVAMARGEYLARVDSDDWVSHRWLESMVSELASRPLACCVFTSRYDVYGKKRIWKRVSQSNLYSTVACGNLLLADAVRKIGGYRSLYWEEYDLYIHLMREGFFIFVEKPLYFYRRHRGSMTNNRLSRVEGWKELLGVWGKDTLLSVGNSPDLTKALKQIRD